MTEKCSNRFCDYYDVSWLNNCSSAVSMEDCPVYRPGGSQTVTKYINIRQERSGALYISGVYKSSKMAEKWAAQLGAPVVVIAIPIEIPGKEV